MQPDTSKYFYVRNEIQKVLFEQELSGQISDGYWENASPRDHYKPWSSATVVVSDDPTRVGHVFIADRDKYALDNAQLLKWVGDRMLEKVRVAIGDPTYSMKQMRAELRDLKAIMRIWLRSEFYDNEERALRALRHARYNREPFKAHVVMVSITPTMADLNGQGE